jgi:hypothetical protein
VGNVPGAVSVPEFAPEKAIKNAQKMKYYNVLSRGLAESGNR